MEENVFQIKNGIKINVEASLKSIIYVKKKDYIWDPVTCSCENGKYLASIIDDSVITCDEIIEETKTSPTNLNENKQSVKHKISTFYLHHFYQLPLYNLTVNIYCY